MTNQNTVAEEKAVRNQVSLEIARYFLLHIKAELKKGENPINQSRIDERTSIEINKEILDRLYSEFSDLESGPIPTFNFIEEWAKRNGFIFKYDEYSFDTYNRIFIERLLSFKNNSAENLRKFREISQKVFSQVDYSQSGFSISFFIRVENNMRELLREIARGIPNIDYELAWRLLFEQSKEYQEVVNEIFEKRLQDALDQSDKLLHNILPAKIASELKRTEKVDPVFVNSATVLFTDFAGFTKLSEKMTPRNLIENLDECFSIFDKIIEKHNLEKIKTIGDSYMCVGGLPEPNRTHPIDATLAALEMVEAISTLKNKKKEKGEPYWDIRVGLHTGPLVAGVIAKKKFSYDVWGDTVNTASRMESSGAPGKVNVSYATYEKIKPYFECIDRGGVETKSKGKINMFFVEGLHSKYILDARIELPEPNQEFKNLYDKIAKDEL
ncbi:adenylate cyclase [Leptospira perolatii]|uniref:Adenylate cyclase n=1 Tax=Leptospira perolatii TaxID=2023191 RepID=A0A2M9ZIG3_9LEPT|nr:adenylate/guanylate cyclase domain-containing protein [Leptospira perolatii]PJZ69093.1 adenylate cyclase [Leptospira perolatii]PJZ71802.1 adenylate cyclase [Leptospira perolatii]